jgi:hypothetical protein
MTEQTKPTHPLASIGGLAGAAVGWLFARYTGASGWIPLGAAILLMIVFGRTPLKPKWFVGAIIATLAHVIWFAVAGAVGGLWAAIIADLLILLVLTVLLWVRPGLVTASLLGLVQVGSLAYNVYLIAKVQLGDPTHKALTAHIVFRMIAIVALVMGYLKFRREGVQPQVDSVRPLP